MTPFRDLLPRYGPFESIELTYDGHVRRPVFVARAFMGDVAVGIGRGSDLESAIDDALTDDTETVTTPDIPPVGDIARWLLRGEGRCYIICVVERTAPTTPANTALTPDRIIAYDTARTPITDYGWLIRNLRTGI
jgi:hypothetical protein